MGNIITKFARLFFGYEERAMISANGNNEQERNQDNTSSTSSRTSTGIRIEGGKADIIAPVQITGDFASVSVNSPTTSTPRQESVEFNIQDPVTTFFGRDEFINTLHDKISHISENEEDRHIRSKLIVICGLAGVGKTQVVRKYIQKFKKSYNHIIWISAETYSGATSNFLQVAKQIPLDVIQNGESKADEQIRDEIYDFVCRKLTLVVYDNVGSFQTEDGKDGLNLILPKSVKAKWKVPAIIVTTRNRNWVNFKLHDLNVFDLSQSLSFFSVMNFEDSEDNRPLLEDVAKLCQGLPIALQQVITFVRNKREARAALGEKSYTLKEFLTDVTSSKRRKFLKTEPDESASTDVYTLFDLTFEQIGSMKHGESALQILDVMSMLNPDNIPTILIKQIFRHLEDKLAKPLNLLRKYTLITRCEGFYQIHRIVQAAIIESSAVLPYVKQNLDQIIASLLPFVNNTPINTNNVLDILNNIVRIHDHVPDDQEENFREFRSILASTLVKAGSYTTAIRLHRINLQLNEKIGGADHDETISSRKCLSEVLVHQGKYDEAESLLHSLTSTLITKLGPAHSDTLEIKNNLAEVMGLRGKYKDAQKLYNDVQQIQTQILGLDHPGTLCTKNNLAVVLVKQGKYEDAHIIYNDVLQKRMQILGPEHLDTLSTQGHLSELLVQQGKFDDAKQLYNEILPMKIRIQGPNHPDTLTTKHNLALVLAKQGQYNDARSLYLEIMQIQIQTLGYDHPYTLSTKNNLALVLNILGKYDDAQRLYNEVLDIRIQILGPNHPNTLITKNNIATVLNAQEKYDEAQELLNDVLESQIQFQGPDHPVTLSTKQNLAAVFDRQGKYIDAERIYNDVLQRQFQILGPNHPDTLTTKNNTAFSLYKQGKYDEAQRVYNDVLEMRIQILGVDHPETQKTKIQLEQVLGKQI